MSFLRIENVHVAGFSAGVPKSIARHTDFAFIESTGVAERRDISLLTTSDLGIPAAERLICDLKWEKSSIDAVLFVSISSDYITPSTACIIQNKLGLSTSCYAADISLACSGWVYGISLAASLVSTGRGNTFKRALVIAGDAKLVVPQDRPLFGAACSVTALEFKEGAEPMFFEFGTDGSGYDRIIIHDGGARNGITPKSFEEYEYDGHIYNKLQLCMNGIDVFSFGISTVPRSVKSLAERYGFSYFNFDYYIFHQANLSMIKAIERKLKLDPAKVPLSIQRFGNTSSASIPLTIVTQLKGSIEKCKTKLLCCGFGTGFSWGTLVFESNNIVISDLVEVE